MKITETALPGVLLIEPRVFTDARGSFMETWHQARYHELGLPAHFVQDNISFSVRNTLRGLHFQHPKAQGKLVQVLHGEVFDVAVDVRVGSPTFGKWVGMKLSGDNAQQLYIPEGFAHGFCVMSDVAAVSYKCTDFYAPEAEGGIAWNDADLGIPWPSQSPLLSPKDASYPSLMRVPQDRLPRYCVRSG
jgi:dTDP-4-dehydrorhamnose 3,5-epimerase